MPTEASVIAASVVNGSISEMAPTNVVFPTPKPPEMMIFAEMGPRFSERTDTFADPFEHGPGTELVQAQVVVDGEVAFGDQVGDQHLGDAERRPQGRGDLGDRGRALADLGD